MMQSEDKVDLLRAHTATQSCQPRVGALPLLQLVMSSHSACNGHEHCANAGLERAVFT